MTEERCYGRERGQSTKIERDDRLRQGGSSSPEARATHTRVCSGQAISCLICTTRPSSP